MLLNDKNIRELCLPDTSGTNVLTTSSANGFRVAKYKGRPMIEPFVGESVKMQGDTRILSYGLSSYGYDIRLKPVFRIFDKPMQGNIIDPRKPNQEQQFATLYEQDEVVLPPGALLIAATVEYFNIPRNVVVVALGKSTLARCGALLNVTPLEPEWEGNLVVEITNGTNHPMYIRANEGIAQLMFHASAEACETSYADKAGKYQAQQGIVGNQV